MFQTTNQITFKNNDLGASTNGGTPIAGRFIEANPTIYMDVPLFQETSIELPTRQSLRKKNPQMQQFLAEKV
jgi:hypothetical protein